MTGSRGPKSKAGAVRRNKPKATTSLKADRAKAPELVGSYLIQTVGWWEAWIDSPQSEHFAATDWQRLLMLVPLVDAFYTTPTPQLMAEIRQNEAKLGATAADRDRLGWRIDEPPAPAGPDGRSSSRERPDPRLAS